MAHAKFSPSAAHRWIKCTASPTREIGLEDTSSEAADRGTLYHAVAEAALRRVTTPAPAAAKVTDAELRRAFGFAYAAIRKHGCAEVGKAAAAKLMTRDECSELVLPYARFVLDELGKGIAAGDPYGIEAKLDVSYLGGECWGTADSWGCSAGVLHVVDLKTGRHPVDPDGNPQAILYALGALAALPASVRRGVTEVRLTIHQGGEATTWTTDPFTLGAWEDVFSQALKAAITGGDLVAGEHCRWCLAKDTCPAFADRGLTIARSEFGPLLSAKDPEVTLATMPGHVAAEFLDRFRIIEAVMAVAVETLATRAYREGLEIPGYKVIRGTKHKAWIDKDTAEDVLRAAYGSRAFKESLLTPTQAEKEFGEAAIAELWTRPTGELRLVTNATRGTAVSAVAAIEFADAGDTAAESD